MKPTESTPRLRRTIAILAVIFLVDVWMMDGLGGGALSVLVGGAGCAILLVAAIWAGVRGRNVVVRSRILRAGLYAFLAAAAIGTLRYRARALEQFHEGLSTGMSVLEVLQGVDRLYTQHPRRWTHIAVWGTMQEYSLADATAAARAPDGIAGATWYAETPHTAADLGSIAKRLAAARQIWFTFRAGVGYLHFFVRLNQSGRVEFVSEVTGHQA
jgi:hypothetical protein